MAGLLTAAVSFPVTKSTSLPSRTSIISPERVTFKKASVHYRDFSTGGRVVSVRAQATDKYIGQCLSNTQISGYASSVVTNHIIIYTDGKFTYKEGQAIGIDAPGSEQVNLYSAASSALGDTRDGKSISLCVARSYNTDSTGKLVPGVTSNFLCDLKPFDDVTMTGPQTNTIFLPTDPRANIIFFATGTGIAPFRSFCGKMFFETHYDYKFKGLAWLFHGVQTSAAKLYDDEFQKIAKNRPCNFRLDYAISREQKTENGKKMYVQDRLVQYAEDVWCLLQRDNTYAYVCGLKGMETGIDAVMTKVSAQNGVTWSDLKAQLIKEKRWNVEVY